jgi:outer membrane protein OmpA-like peptidoglycan-associated protein
MPATPASPAGQAKAAEAPKPVQPAKVAEVPKPAQPTKVAEVPKPAQPAKAVEAPRPVQMAKLAETPPAAEPFTRGTKVVLAGDTLFKLGKSGIRDLSREGKQRLDEVAAKIKALGEVELIKIVGHADATGKAEANRKLSEARAKSVKSYLVAKGVKPGVIITSGMGDSHPVVQCDMSLPSQELAECLAPNRRVEIEVVAKVQ